MPTDTSRADVGFICEASPRSEFEVEVSSSSARFSLRADPNLFHHFKNVDHHYHYYDCARVVLQVAQGLNVKPFRPMVQVKSALCVHRESGELRAV